MSESRPRRGVGDLVWGFDVLGAAFADAPEIFRTKTFRFTALAATAIGLLLANHLAHLHLHFNRVLVGGEIRTVLTDCGAIVSIAGLRRAAAAARR